MEAAWKAVLVESDRRCDLHNRVRDDLVLKANTELKNWQKENYHKVSNNTQIVGTGGNPPDPLTKKLNDDCRLK